MQALDDPRKFPAGDKPAVTPNVSVEIDADASPAKRGRILIVDDEPLLRRGLERILVRAGFEVQTAADGQEAASLLDGQSFDTVVSDISMPGMDGLLLLRAVREWDLDLPVILVTGAPTVETAVAALEYGAFQYLSKPVDQTRIEQTVDKAVRLYAMARAKRQALALLGADGAQAGDRAGLEASFDRALETLWTAFQPIVHANDGSLFGYEALVRSSEPTLPHPGALLDAAEKLDKLHDLGRVIRNEAGRHMTDAPVDSCLFVNLHTRDLLDETLFAETSVLTKIASRVVLEITERASLEEVKDIRRRIAALRERGFRIAIDDLGAGYAGLSSFALLEPEIVKLDMSLVRDVHKNATKQKLVRTMSALCQDMGMKVVGEGVETLEERDALIELGCDLLQGYLIAKPGRAFPTMTPRTGPGLASRKVNA